MMTFVQSGKSLLRDRSARRWTFNYRRKLQASFPTIEVTGFARSYSQLSQSNPGVTWIAPQQKKTRQDDS